MNESDTSGREFLRKYGHHYNDSPEHKEYWKKNFHDPTPDDPVTHHIINDETHRCIFCGIIDARGIHPFMHILGSY